MPSKIRQCEYIKSEEVDGGVRLCQHFEGLRGQHCSSNTNIKPPKGIVLTYCPTNINMYRLPSPSGPSSMKISLKAISFDVLPRF